MKFTYSLLRSYIFIIFILTADFTTGQDYTQKAINHAKKQIYLEIEKIETNGTILNPVTINNNKTYYCDYTDWRSGFFPGSIWYLYELTKDKTLLPLAHKYTEALYAARKLTWHHDIGFIINCSYGNGLRLTQKESYKRVIIEAAKSLCTRFREKAGIIQSWDVTNGWQSQKGWECPVIIDNMMNLELLFEATKLSGDSTFYKIAISHADKTLKEHFRANGSCYHVIDYNIKNGEVRNKHTAQGYSHESAWSRGQAWAIYGYSMCYRYTKDIKYLNQSIKTFNFMKTHPNMPIDLIPYWDMDSPKIPNDYKDVSSAAIIASALYEISTFNIPEAKSYKRYADKIIKHLASVQYTATLGRNGNFILMHSVGSIPHNSEIDVPLNYADYYYLEALKRKTDIESKKNI